MEIEQLEEIEHKLFGVVETVHIRDGAVWFQESFDVFEDEDTGDAAWRTLLNVQDDLESLGLRAVNTDSDNDTVWGQVVPLESEK